MLCYLPDEVQLRSCVHACALDDALAILFCDVCGGLTYGERAGMLDEVKTCHVEQGST